MIFDYQFRNYNFRALIYMILLSVLGILVVGSASNQDRSSVIKQIIGVVVSLIICLVLSLIDYMQETVSMVLHSTDRSRNMSRIRRFMCLQAISTETTLIWTCSTGRSVTVTYIIFFQRTVK